MTDLRVNILRQFDNYVRNEIEDEDIFYDLWLMDGVPDGADEEMLEFIASNDECWGRTVNCFAECCRRAGLI